jgi:hypothetical protein
MRIQNLSWALLAFLIFATPASADPIVFSTSDSQFHPGVNNQGWWSATRNNVDLNESYFVGLACDTAACTTIHDNRDFFTFDLRSLNGAVASATLELQRDGNESPFPIFGLFDVSTDPVTLNNNTGTSAAIFADLGTGRSYGAFRVTNGGPNDVLRFPLNTAATADIQAHAGGFFSIGGAILGGGFLFGGSGENGGRLVITTESVQAPTPEPAALTYLMLGAAVLLRRGRTRKACHESVPRR